MPVTSAIVAAAGRGTRMPGDAPKQFRALGDRPVLAWAAAAIGATPGVTEIVVGAEAGMLETAAAIVAEWAPGLTIKPVTGGADRQETVRLCLAACDPDAEVIVVHDAARPFAGPDLFRRVIEAAAKDGAATAAVPPADTIKMADDSAPGGAQNLPRGRLWQVQTPQAFRRDLIQRAHAVAAGENFSGTDDTVLVERLGHRVTMVESSPLNFKVTTPADFSMARAFVENTTDAVNAVRVGQGFDAHRLVEGRKLVLGGVTVPFERGLLGHSDADVLAHAVTDAVLGAAALGDIGTHFPPSDPKWKDADSIELLRRASALAAEKGFRVTSMDATVIAEAPRLAPFVEEMRRRLADALGCPVDGVSVKAKTTEGMGFCGRGEGMAALAVATLRK